MRNSILNRLRKGKFLLLDGATGSELQRRGVSINRGTSTTERPVTPSEYQSDLNQFGSLGVWSASANIDAPDVVQQIHEDYLKVGADIITSNNFYSCRSMMQKIGKSWEEYTRQGGEIAIQARNNINPNAYVAGGFAPSEVIGNLKEECEEMSVLLAKTGVDLVLLEYFGGDVVHKSPVEDCVTAVDACAKTGLPVFLGVSRITNQGTMMHGNTLAELCEALRGHKVDCILLMCSSPEAISTGLPKLHTAFNGPIGAYAEIGYDENPKFGLPGEPFFTIKPTLTPEEYAEYALEWKKMGAQIIGGCCATTPEYIRTIRSVVKK